jgi:hypothetical protein
VASPIITATIRPESNAQNIPKSACKKYVIRKENTADNTAAVQVAFRSALERAAISAFSPTLTIKLPIMEAIMPPAEINIGRYQAVVALVTMPIPTAKADKVMAAMIAST